MDVTKLASGATALFLGHNSDDEFTDRLNYRYTVGLLMFFTVMISTKQYSSEVIKCWVPAHLIIYEEYVGEICWVQNTYYIPYNVTIPKHEIEREKSEIKYYQWVSFVLLIQAFFFYMPRIFWTSFSGKGGLYLSDLVEAARNYKSGDKFYKKGSYMEYLVLNIDQFVDDQRRWETSRSRSPIVRFLGSSVPCFGRYLGNYILVLYMITKFMFIFNAIVQTSLISVFLGQSFWMFGYGYVMGLINGSGWNVPNSKYFPRVTLCDFMIREIGNPQKAHRYTVECVLPVNLFNQQIFTVIWFWYIIVLICNIIGVLVWCNRLFPSRAKKWITLRTNLFNSNVSQNQVPNRLKHFLQYYLEPDGIFMIRMIGTNTSDYVATDLIHQLWCQHDEKYGHLFPNEPHNSSKRACSFNHQRIDEVKAMYCKNNGYTYPQVVSKINNPDYKMNEYKSNNYVYPEKTYTEARLNLYARKHNINGFNEYEAAKKKAEEEEEALMEEIMQDEDLGSHGQKSDAEDLNLIRRRICKALLMGTTKRTKRRKSKDATVEKTRPLINDDTTNSDDSDSYSEQAYHQEFTRQEQEAEDREKEKQRKMQEKFEAAINKDESELL